MAFIDIDAVAAAQLIAELVEEGSSVPVFKYCDLAELETIRAVVEKLSESCGAFTVLVNNAASDNRHSPQDLTPDYWRNRLDVNLGQQFFCAQAVHQYMREQKRGSIINLGSVSYQLALPNLIAYATSKAAVIGLSRSLAREWGVDNIRVNTLVPGCVMTEKQLKLWISDEDEAKIQQQQCLKKRIVGADIANMALFLASQSSAACTAQEFIVDGGII